MAYTELASLPWAAELMIGGQMVAAMEDDFLSSYSSASYSTMYPNLASFGSPAEGHAFSCSSADTSGADVSSPSIISFSNSPATRGLKRDSEMTISQNEKRIKTGVRPPAQAHDHIIAERKRRENLNRRFIGLSALLPGLKKMDKASVLGDAIKYVKELQQRVAALEERTAERTMKSAVLSRKYEDGQDEEDSDGTPGPEIEVKLCEKNVLVRVHCEKRKGVLTRLLAEMEKFHLSVVSTSSIPFANTTLDITVTAQVDDGFSLSVKDLVKHLHVACRQLI
ncbi:transcription factor bHLH25-like [Wolffia australiana]